MTVVLFQHGLGGDDGQVARHWPATTAQRVTRNSRGHGGAALGTERPFSLAMFADDALAAVQAPLFVAVGISMGAAIALRLACLHPARVAGLVLIRPAWGFDPAPANMAPVRDIAGLLRRMPPAKARAAFAASPMGQRLAQEAPDNLASLLAYCDRPDATEFATVLADIAADGPGITPRDAAALRLPCLILANDGDLIHPLATAGQLAAAIPGARLAEVPPKSIAPEAHLAAIRTALAAFLSSVAKAQP